MNMPNLREDGYTVEMEPISHTVAEEKVEQNADPEDPAKTELIDFGTTEVTDEASDELPGFGILAAGASLLFVSRRFRKQSMHQRSKENHLPHRRAYGNLVSVRRTTPNSWN